MHLVTRQDKRTISAVNVREELTPGQKWFVVWCYQLMDIKEARAAFGIHRTRELVATCLGIAQGTVSTIMTAYNAGNTTDFEPSQQDKVRYNRSGKGARACNIAAGFISLVNGRMEAGFMQNSINCWNASLKRKADVEEDEDYHGNSDTAKVKQWFMKLCITLKKQHGHCRIHMDGSLSQKHNQQKPNYELKSSRNATGLQKEV
ncbi:hypothetical protein PC123_g14617 [Phytophthora cactorum]|nr:hypothetical protein PC123_g14617 [Phytophthora cactorum]